MNLYIFNKLSNAAVFGIGTYLRELTAALRYSQINVFVVNLNSHKTYLQIEGIDGIQYWHIPSPVFEQRAISNQKQLELYHRNIVYLLQLHITDKNDLIFHLNFMDCKSLVDCLKNAFACKIVLTVHYLDSILFLTGNISQLRRIVSHPNDLTEPVEIEVKYSFQRERELFQSVNKIICLSNHAFNLLHQDYNIEKEKIAVIYNGLSDVADR